MIEGGANGGILLAMGTVGLAIGFAGLLATLSALAAALSASILLTLKAIAILENTDNDRNTCKTYGSGLFYSIISLIFNTIGLGYLTRPSFLAKYGGALAGDATLVGALVANIQIPMQK